MTPMLLAAIDAMANSKVPHNWLFDATNVEISWMLPLLGSWVSGFFDRYQ
jgi:dynein heavy chain